jgi:hypothetical protein
VNLVPVLFSLGRRSADDHWLCRHPGWPHMGGPEAISRSTKSIPGVVDTVTARIGKPGLRFLDYTGRAVAWRWDQTQRRARCLSTK